MRSNADKIDRATAEQFWGWQTVYGYQTQLWIWRFRLHIFHKEDPGVAMHDHPWPFWTLPLTAYREEVLPEGATETEIRTVPAFWVTYRPANYTHRILAPRWKTITLCFAGRGGRPWHYVYLIAGKVHRIPWRRYLAKADPSAGATT